MLTTDRSIREAHARDASGIERVPDAVARPGSREEVLELLRSASSDRTPVTAAGAQTSTTAASITDSGILLSMRGLDRVLDLDVARCRVRVQAGANLGELKRQLAAEGLLFAPDPTSEQDITVGGAIACNASGARSLRYGATRQHVSGLTVALASGEVLELHRTPLEKNTVGFALAQDPVDWFVGSEGTLGIVMEAELALLPLPEWVVGLGIPFASESSALSFVARARAAGSVSPRCLEYFDGGALAIARAEQQRAELGRWPANAGAFVYAEESGEHGAEPPLDAWLELAESHGAMADDVVVMDSDTAIREARQARHSVPATMIERGNAFRPQGGRRVSTDWAVPFGALSGAIAESRRLADAAGVEPPVVYGHAGSGHPHQNYVARDAEELARTELVVEATLQHVIALGGTVAAEHGIGKLKRRWLPMQMRPWQIAVMHAVKRELDPLGILAPGNVLP